MFHGVYELKVTLNDVEYDMREMDLRSVWGNYLWNAATVSKPVCVSTRPGMCVTVRVVRVSLYDIVCIYASLSLGYWSGEQHAESAAAGRNKQLNMSLCRISRRWNTQYKTQYHSIPLHFQSYLFLIPYNKTYFCFQQKGFDNGRKLPVFVCSVSKMHVVVDQPWWTVRSYCHSFTCLLITIEIYLSYCQERSQTGAAGFL